MHIATQGGNVHIIKPNDLIIDETGMNPNMDINIIIPPEKKNIQSIISLELFNLFFKSKITAIDTPIKAIDI